VRVPPRLHPGDTLAVVAPSSPFDSERLHRGVARLESLGLRVILPAGLTAAEGYLAGSDEHRAGLFMEMLQRSDVRALVCARGGYGALRLLARIDFRQMATTAKLIVGFSDATALLAAFWQRCRWVTIHGPTVSCLADADGETLEQFARLLMGDEATVLPAGRALAPGVAEGVLVGGNLTLLCHLLGTPFFPSLAGRILLLEDRGEALYRVDRMLHHLCLAGALSSLAGLVLGRFDGCGPSGGLERLIHEVFDPFGIPVVTGVAIGHGSRNLAVPLGLPVRLDAGRLRLEIPPLPAAASPGSAP
jgi:muramoyltetrapeptide carboxypeptidase